MRSRRWTRKKRRKRRTKWRMRIRKTRTKTKTMMRTAVPRCKVRRKKKTRRDQEGITEEKKNIEKLHESILFAAFLYSSCYDGRVGYRGNTIIL